MGRTIMFEQDYVVYYEKVIWLILNVDKMR